MYRYVHVGHLHPIWVVMIQELTIEQPRGDTETRISEVPRQEDKERESADKNTVLL